jgi:hypothetical protein
MEFENRPPFLLNMREDPMYPTGACAQAPKVVELTQHHPPISIGEVRYLCNLPGSKKHLGVFIEIQICLLKKIYYLYPTKTSYVPFFNPWARM